MTLKPCWLLVLLFALSAAGATIKLDTLTVGSETYSNVTFLGANATDVYFTHNKGIANVKLRLLPAELQKQFHYDAAAAAAAERKQLEDDQRYQTKLAANLAAQAAAAEQAAKLALPLPPLSDAISPKSLLGKPAPNIDPDQWVSDKPSLQGKYVLLSFWAPWSSACKKALPALNELQKHFPEKLVVVGVTTNSASDIEDAGAPRLTFASAIDAKARLAKAFDVTSIPCVVLIDPSGTIKYQGHPAAISEIQVSELIARMGR